MVNFTEVKAQSTDADELLQYQSHTLEVTLSGRTHADIFRFLQQLQVNMPGLSVSAPSLSGFGGTPSGNFKLHFFLSPERFKSEE